MRTVDIGDVVELEATVTKTKDGSPAKPEDFYWKVVPPSGNPSKPAVVEEGEGVFSGTYEPTKAGEHLYLFLAKGGDKVAGEGKFMVRTPKVPRD